MLPYIIQISDLHLNIDPDKCYRGISSQQWFSMVLNHIFDVFPNFEKLIFTGDLSHDEQRSTYKRLKDQLKDTIAKCYFIPGNHDNPSSIQDVLVKPHCGQNQNSPCFSHITAGWHLIGLDSSVEGKVYGRLGPSQKEWLRKQLETFKHFPTVVFIHHPPVPVNSPWLDEIGLHKPEPLLEILQNNRQVKGLFCGHIHQKFETSVRGLKIFCAPSTAMQFRPQTSSCEIHLIPPGFRVIELGETNIKSRVVRIPRTKLHHFGVRLMKQSGNL